MRGLRVGLYAFETVRWNLEKKRTFHVLSMAPRFPVAPHWFEDVCILELGCVSAQEVSTR